MENGKLEPEARLKVIFDLLEERDGLRVYINGPFEIYLERTDGFERTSMKFTGADELNSLIRHLGSQVGRELTLDEKVVHFRLSGGLSVAVLRPPGSTSPVLCITR